MADIGVCWIVFLVLCLLFDVDAMFTQAKRTLAKKCSHSRVHKLLAADCNGMDLKSIPQNLESDIEVIDVSFNRIRELRKDSFEKYSYLKYLYLHENIIHRIEEGTFKNLKELEVVNLSLNPIQKIPHDLFYLPKLRKLSLDEVELDVDHFDDLLDLPSISSLTSLSLSNSRLRVLPPLDKFPFIQYLNVSGNHLTSISASELAHTCFLLQIDLNSNWNFFKKPSCNCTSFVDWTTKHNITLAPPFQLTCPQMEQSKEVCLNMSRSENEGTYNSCKALHLEQVSRAEWNKIWIIIGIVTGVCFLIIIALFWFINRMCKTKQTKGLQNSSSPHNLHSTTASQRGEAQKNLLSNHNNVSL